MFWNIFWLILAWYAVSIAYFTTVICQKDHSQDYPGWELFICFPIIVTAITVRIVYGALLKR